MVRGYDYSILSIYADYVEIRLDNYHSNCIDFDKLKKSINIQKNVKKRCKTEQTNEYWKMWYPTKKDSFLIIFNIDGYVVLYLPALNNFCENIKNTEQMLSNFKKK